MRQIADKLRTNAERIMSLWEARANAEVRPAEELTSLILRDALLEVIQELATAMETKKLWTPLGLRQEFVRLENAKEHGKQRADTEAYNLAEVIIEFHILRQVIFEVLEEEAPLSKSDRDFIISSFERTVNDSACVFADLQLKNHERFTLTLVHDFRNPLTVIKMASQYAHSETALTPELQFVFEKIDRNVKRLDEMIRELLDVSRLKSGKGFVVNAKEMRLDELINQTVAKFNQTYGVRFEARAAEEITGCWDRDGLLRILENLSLNALKYGNAASPIVIHALKVDDHVKIIVHNSGNPIAPEEQGNIFEAFDRASSATGTKGWGLGLALVKGMAHAHKGTVRVESSLEKGTDFIVELPCRAS
jgi:signal transduction histidine kinase